jgi:hypothetical protein
MKIHLSELDEKRFGVVTAKMNMEANDELDTAVVWCKVHNVQFLIARIATDQIDIAQRLEHTGFYLTDTLVYFRNKKIKLSTFKLPSGYSWRLAAANDAEAVNSLAKQTFGGYSGHYHADPKLDAKDCDLVYSSWAANSCADQSLADAVILIFKETEVAGFATLKRVEDYMCEGILFGVGPKHQGKSLYKSLMDLAQQWAIESHYSQMIVSTQVTNLAVQKVWCRQGFEPYKSFYTFHKWF